MITTALFYDLKNICARSVAAAKTSAVALFYYLKNMCAVISK